MVEADGVGVEDGRFDGVGDAEGVVVVLGYAPDVSLVPSLELPGAGWLGLAVGFGCPSVVLVLELPMLWLLEGEGLALRDGCGEVLGDGLGRVLLPFPSESLLVLLVLLVSPPGAVAFALLSFCAYNLLHAS